VISTVSTKDHSSRTVEDTL